MWRLKVIYKFIVGIHREIPHWYKCDRELFGYGVVHAIINNPLWLKASLMSDIQYEKFIKEAR